ncbi:hypothetical protein LCH21_02500 [Patescibacteria group bacterium]|nr:hypothetical protein [Patescibacteria group bacterium]
MAKTTRPVDTFTVLVDRLPFSCSYELFCVGLAEATIGGRTWLNDRVERGKEKQDSTYAGLIFDPTDSLGGPIAAINLGSSDTSRLVNAAGKVDWMQLHPDVDFDQAFTEMPWLIGSGQFLYGHATTRCGFPAAGSGLSAKGDRRIMNVMLEVLADTVRPGMVEAMTGLRDNGAKWLDGEPRPEYAEMADICQGWQTVTVS